MSASSVSGLDVLSQGPALFLDNRANQSPVLKLLLSSLDELVARVSKGADQARHLAETGATPPRTKDFQSCVHPEVVPNSLHLRLQRRHEAFPKEQQIVRESIG